MIALTLCIQSALAGVAINAEGWTDVTPSADSRQFYVSSSTGNDANPGTLAAPLKTIGAAAWKCRAGYPDQVLLRRGDTFREAVNWSTGGRSATEPQYLGAYGTGPRPIIAPPAGGNGWEASNNRVGFVVVAGISFQATRDAANTAPGGTGLRWFGPGDALIFEDVEVKGFGTGATIEGASLSSAVSNVRFNRCVIVDNYPASGGRGQGIYVTCASNVRFTECLLDRNGWSPTATGATKNVWSHDAYIDNEQWTADGLPGPGTGFVVERCILTRGASHGLQLRCGGTVTDCLFAENAIALLVGGGDGFATASPGGISFTATNNVILQSVDISTDLAGQRGYGFDLVNIKAGTATGNIIAHDKSVGSSGHGVSVDLPAAGLALSSNIVFDWHNPKLFATGVSVSEPAPGNTWLGFGAVNPGYLDPARDLGSYNATLGGTPSLDAFIVRARQQSRQTWDGRYTAAAANAYIRAGFAPGTATPAPAPASGGTSGGTSGVTFDITVSITPTGGSFRAVDAAGNVTQGNVGKASLSISR